MTSLAALRPDILEDPNFNAHEYMLRTDPEYRRRFNELLTTRMFALIEALAVKSGLGFDLVTGQVTGLSEAQKAKLADPGVLLGFTGGTVKEFRPDHANRVQAQSDATGTWQDQVYAGPNNPPRSERVGETEEDVFRSDDATRIPNPGETLEADAKRDFDAENNAANAAREKAAKDADEIRQKAEEAAAKAEAKALEDAEKAAEKEREAAAKEAEEASKADEKKA